MKKNLYYITPTVEFVEYASEGVLCQSGAIEGWVEKDLTSATASEAAIEIPDIQL